MRNMLIVLCHEFLQRLRRPAFWLLVAIVAVALAVAYVLPVVAASRADQTPIVLLVDETGLFEDDLLGSAEIEFRSMPSVDYAQRSMDNSADIDAILHIPMRQTTIPHDAFIYYHGHIPSLQLQSIIDSRLQSLLRTAILRDVYELDMQHRLSLDNAHISLHTLDTATGRDGHTATKSALASILSACMLLMLVVLGVQVMRSVQSERHNRISEIILSSVHPRQLLSGKVCAVGLAGLLQIGLIGLLVAAVIVVVQSLYPDLFNAANALQQHLSLASKGSAATAQYSTAPIAVDPVVAGLSAIRWGTVVAGFVVVLMVAYLMYAMLLALLVARLDADADAVGWPLAVLSPTLIATAIVPLMLTAPAGALARWLTFVPLTAPVALVARLPFGLPWWQAVVSIGGMLTVAVVAALLKRKA